MNRLWLPVGLVFLLVAQQPSALVEHGGLFHLATCKAVPRGTATPSQPSEVIARSLKVCMVCRPDREASFAAYIEANGPIVYRMQSSSSYHTAGCQLAARFPITPTTFARASGELKLDDCILCRPNELPGIGVILAARRAERQAALTAEAEAAAIRRKEREASETARLEEVRRLAELDRARKEEAAIVAAKLERTRPFTPLTELNGRAAAKKVIASLNDPSVAKVSESKNTLFRLLFRDGVKESAPEYSGDPIDIMSDESIAITLMGPGMAFEFQASERIRKMEPLGLIPWTPSVTITVSPTSINSPDVERVVLQRDGVVVAPLRSTLALRAMETRMGAKFTAHAGTVAFPISAFHPRAESVTVTIIPASGQNTVKRLTTAELRRIQ